MRLQAPLRRRLDELRWRGRLPEEDLVIKGVNLGNWLVLEKWMSPGCSTARRPRTSSTCARTSTSASGSGSRSTGTPTSPNGTSPTSRRAVSTRSGSRSLLRLRGPRRLHGLRGVPGPCLRLGGDLRLRVLIDLHTVPDSQNGFDNGGICGVCKWHTEPGVRRGGAGRAGAAHRPLPRTSRRCGGSRCSTSRSRRSCGTRSTSRGGTRRAIPS